MGAAFLVEYIPEAILLALAYGVLGWCKHLCCSTRARERELDKRERELDKREHTQFW